MVLYVLVLQEYSKWVSNTTINLLSRARQYIKSVGPLKYFIDSGDHRRDTDVKRWEKWDKWAKVATSGNYNPLRIAVKRTGSCPDHTFMVERSFYYQWIGRKKTCNGMSWFVMALCLLEAAIRRYKWIYFYFCAALKKPPDLVKAGGKRVYKGGKFIYGKPRHALRCWMIRFSWLYTLVLLCTLSMAMNNDTWESYMNYHRELALAKNRTSRSPVDKLLDSAGMPVLTEQDDPMCAEDITFHPSWTNNDTF
jgi:hypothetical protein